MDGQEPAERKRRVVELVGKVVSDARDKTITVEVNHTLQHKVYRKFITRSTRYHAHDEKNEAKVGDIVRIRMTRPLSKQKNHRLVEIVTSAKAKHGEA
ncbi:MAG: 30S ribosomal protein S17 [Planctomycetota bacterium]